MASPAVIAFHNAQMEQERKRVALRIANGTKASSNLVIGHRMQHPSYKGLPDNSTGSRNQPFFAMKDESQCPLEDKIRMRGGVLSTDAGQQYARSILKRRAEDTDNIRRIEDGLPPVPPKLLELDESESKSLELNTIIDAIDDAIDAGTTFGIPLSEVSKLPRLLISLSPTFSEEQITALIDVFDDLYRRADTPQSIRRPNRLGDAEDAAESVSNARLAIPLGRCLAFLEEILKVVNLDNEGDKRIALLGIAKRSFKGAIKAREAERLLPPVAEAPAAQTDAEFEAEDLGGPEPTMQQLFPDIASIFAPSGRSAAAAAAEEEEEEAPPPTSLRRRRLVPPEPTEEDRVRAAYQQWFSSLGSDSKKAARSRMRYYDGSSGKVANPLSGAELFRMVANTGFAPERREL